MQPLVSIIIPVYNADRFVRQAMQSALNQTYNNIEIIVINDGSTDRSPEIIGEFSDPRIKVIHQHNKGGSSARNAGIETAKGEYIKFLDADDELLPQAIEMQVIQSNGLNENAIVFGDFNFINQEGKIISSHKFNNSNKLNQDPESFFLNNWEILISCPLHKKAYLENIGGFDENLPFGQESDLHFRIAINNIRFIYQEANVFNYRSHLESARISLNRIYNNMETDVMVYSLDKKISLIMEKRGKLNETQQKYFALSFFGLARKSFINQNKSDGKYYLSRSKQYSKYMIPPYNQNPIFGILYQVSGVFLGFVRLEKIIRRIRIKASQKPRELDVLFQQ